MKKRNLKIKSYNRAKSNDLFDGHHVYSNITYDVNTECYTVKLKYFHTQRKLKITGEIPNPITKDDIDKEKDALVISAKWSRDNDDPHSRKRIKYKRLSVLEIDLVISKEFEPGYKFKYQLNDEKRSLFERNTKDATGMLILDENCDIIIPPPPKR